MKDQKIPDTKKLEEIALIIAGKTEEKFCESCNTSKAHETYKALSACFSENFATMNSLEKNAALKGLVQGLKEIVQPPESGHNVGDTCVISGRN